MFDSNIPLSVKSFDVAPLIKQYDDQKMQQTKLQDMAQERDLRAEQLKSAQLQSSEEARQAHEAQTLRGLAQVNDLRTTEGQDQYLKDVGKLGLGHKLPELSAAFAAQRAAAEKARIDKQKAERQDHIDFLDVRSRLLPTATDEASYQSVRARLQRMGDDLSGLEPNFNPEAVKGHIGEVLTHKERLELENKNDIERGKADALALDNKKFGETVRNNKEQNAIARDKNSIDRAAAAAKSELVGGVNVPGLRPIPGVQITKDSVKKVKDGAIAYDELQKQLNGLVDMYAGKEDPKTGKRSGGTGTEFAGEKARTLQSKLRQIQLTLKGPEFLQLGVLTGPDMKLLDEMVGDPTSFWNNVKAASGVMGDPVMPQLTELKSFIDGKYASALKRNGFEVGDATASAANGSTVKTASGKSFVIETEK